MKFMENEMDLRTEQNNNPEEASQEQNEVENSSRKTRDSSLVSDHTLEDVENISSTDDLEEGQVDYNHLSKEELLKVVKDLVSDTNFAKCDLIINEVRPLFKSIRNKEKAIAIKAFIADGGAKDDFEYRGDKVDHEFDATLKLIKSKRNAFFKEQDQLKNENLIKKNAILNKLRSLEDGEGAENSFSIFKDLQREWKTIGPVPNSHARSLWANYSALVDLYYDQRNIYFELKELDRKKNLEYKEELCQRAEKLLEVESIKDAVKELNELHNEFKHTGPVTRENKDAIWERFKTASDAVYARRDEHMAVLLETFKVNLEEKRKVIAQLKELASFSSDRIKEWNQKTKEIIEFQKRWEAIGPVPRSQTKSINKEFWSVFKGFFSTKSSFFKKLDGERDQNLELKKELVKKVDTIKDSTDWENVSEELKRLQVAWKEIGPVPEKQREKIYQEFKQACDYFFEKRRQQFGKQDEEQSQNLDKKKEICNWLEKQVNEKSGSEEDLKAQIEKFNALGFVPRKAIKSIKSRFDKAVEKYMASIPALATTDKERLKMEVQLSGLRNAPNGERIIHNKEQAIKTQIHKAENDLAILKNNLEFFGRSKNAEKLKGEFTEKLEVAADHLKDLKKQLKLLKTVS